MACQTIVVHLLFRVAVHAPLHRHFHPGFCRWLFTPSDVSMTLLTVHPCEDHVTAVREEDIVRLLVDALPWKPLAILLVLSDLLFVWMFGQGLFVAFHTGCHFWQARKGLFLIEGMAGGALDALFVMFLVVKRERLFKSKT